MTLSVELQKKYTTECDVDFYGAFVISHPNATTRYLINYHEQFIGNGPDGYPHIFEAVPAKIVLPTRDASGRSEMSITWCGIEDEAVSFLNEAIADGTKPIVCHYSVFIAGSPVAQINPWVIFNLTNVAVIEGAVSATANRSDTLNRKFPYEVYRLPKFPGLRRK